MRINAYILAADPAWIEASVLSYYEHVNRIVVSYDERSVGWTGASIDAASCIHRLKTIDCAGKLDYRPGNYGRTGRDPMENDTHQRQCALNQAGEGADWVLQLDTDEVLPRAGRFFEELVQVGLDFEAVDWPMRTLFQKIPDGRFLEVCSVLRRTVCSFPGPIAVRAGSRLKHARQPASERTWRCDVRKKDTDAAAGGRKVDKVIEEDTAVLHFSWVRSEEEMQKKLQSWSHSHQFDWVRYVDRVWKRAPKRWPLIYRFHPLVPRWWPALRPVNLSRYIEVATPMPSS